MKEKRLMMNNQKIKILVVGESNSGKSTLARLIYDTLKENNLKPIISKHTQLDLAPPYSMKKLLNSILGKSVKLEIVQVNRESYNQTKFKSLKPSDYDV